MKKRLACILTAGVMLINCVSAGIMVSADTYGVLKNNASERIDVVENKHDNNSFLEYLSLHSTAEYSEQAIVKKMDNATLGTNNVNFSVSVDCDGFYGVGLSYKTIDNAYSNVKIGVKIDGVYPYDEATEFELPRMWCNDGAANRVDAAGNEFAPQQIEYKDFYYNEPICDVTESNEKYVIYLSKGVHNVEIVSVDGKIEIEYFAFSTSKKEEKYSKPTDSSLYYEGEKVVIEGEKATLKSSYFLIGRADTSTLDVSPNSAEYSKINNIGGGNWKTIGDTIIWETPEVEEGYYQIGFSFRQNFSIGSKVYRKLTIDGKVPFEEANAIGFNYNDNWQKMIFSDAEEEPYLVYLSKGKHEIALTATAGDVAVVRDILIKASEELGSLYIDMTMITGETVDIYRDYELFSQIGDMQERLEKIRTLLDKAGELLLKVSGESSGSNYSIINNMSQVVTQMLENKYEAHRYKDYYYTNYCSVSSVIQSLTEMPLSLDKIVLVAPEEQKPFEKVGFFEKVLFSTRRFVVTFIKDYNMVSKSDENSLTVWINWGRDQAQVLSSLLDNSFTPKTGISVDLKLSNASLVQATLLGDGPDCVLMSSRSDPVNLAMRGVLYDLSQFEDCDEILNRFQEGADIPYRYKDGLYALPDTQNFFVMFYRKDILDELGIEVPKTWEDFSLAAKILMRNNMNVSLPNNVATDLSQINSGVGSNNIFPSLLLQKNVPIYAEDGKSTNLLSADVMETMEMWTNFYRKQKFPITMDFYTRFRIGTTPLGINTYTFYTTLKAAASEIDGLWGVTTIPGTVLEDGTISKVTSGGGTGCAILKNCDNYDAAWELLKWWTDEQTQLSYSNEIEAILGPTGRIAVANVNAFKNLAWEREATQEFLDAWEEVVEIPEYPGSYYVARSIYQCFWNVVNTNKNPKDMLMKYGKEADKEMARKWKQYVNR